MKARVTNEQATAGAKSAVSYSLISRWPPSFSRLRLGCPAAAASLARPLPLLLPPPAATAAAAAARGRGRLEVRPVHFQPRDLDVREPAERLESPELVDVLEHLQRLLHVKRVHDQLVVRLIGEAGQREERAADVIVTHSLPAAGEGGPPLQDRPPRCPTQEAPDSGARMHARQAPERCTYAVARH